MFNICSDPRDKLHNCLIGFNNVGMNLTQASPILIDGSRAYVVKKQHANTSEFVGVLVSLCSCQRLVAEGFSFVWLKIWSPGKWII